MNYNESYLLTEVIKENNIKQYLNLIKKFSYELYEHSIRVGYLTYKIGKYLNLNTKDKETLILAGLLHDIGKLKVPHEILTSPAKLTKQELDIIDKHSQYSYEILSKLENTDVKTISAMHHFFSKRNDSEVNKEDDLYKLAELLSIADVFDALASERSYKQRLDFNDIYTIMISDNFTWDKELVKEILYEVFK